MTKEAHLRKDHWAKGEWIDNVIYGLLADEWANRSEPFPRHPAEGLTVQQRETRR